MATELPRILQVFASGDFEAGQPLGTPGLGDEDFPPIDDMHLGVLSTNLGVAGNPVPNNPDGSPGSCQGAGDDGLLQFPAACDGGVEGNFLTFRAGDDIEALGENFACISALGTGGCGQEQQLESMLKALSSSDDYTFFPGDQLGQGESGNEGFLRDDALLVVLMVTDEDDCSLPEMNAPVMAFGVNGTADVTVMDPSDAQYDESITLDLRTPLNLRCGTYTNALWPVSRFHDGLLALKPGHPERVYFAAIVGVPVALENMTTDTILANAVMQFVPEDPVDFYRLDNAPLASCVRDHDGDPNTPTQNAYPPRRIVELAGLFGDRGIVQSICRDDFSGPIDRVVQTVFGDAR